MSELEVEILQLAQRIRSLSEHSKGDANDRYFRLEKIRELVNALIPRLEESIAQHDPMIEHLEDPIVLKQKSA